MSLNLEMGGDTHNQGKNQYVPAAAQHYIIIYFWLGILPNKKSIWTLCNCICEVCQLRNLSLPKMLWSVSSINYDLHMTAPIISRTAYSTLSSLIFAKGLP